MKHRNFVYVGEPIPEIRTRPTSAIKDGEWVPPEPCCVAINAPEHTGFLLHLQKSMLLSLVKRNLLSASQMEQVMQRIERKA